MASIAAGTVIDFHEVFMYHRVQGRLLISFLDFWMTFARQSPLSALTQKFSAGEGTSSLQQIQLAADALWWLQPSKWEAIRDGNFNNTVTWFVTSLSIFDNYSLISSCNSEDDYIVLQDKRINPYSSVVVSRRLTTLLNVWICLWPKPDMNTNYMNDF